MSAAYRKVRKLVLVGFAVAIGSLLFVGVVAQKSANEFIKTDNLALTHQEILDRLAEIRRSVARAESEQRGYLLTGKREYFTSFDQTPGLLENQYARLMELCRGGPNEVDLIRSKALAIDRLEELNRTLRLYREKGKSAVELKMQAEAGLDLMNQFRGTMEAMIMREKTALRTAGLSNVSNRDSVTRAVIMGLAVAVLAVLASMLMVIRDSRRRVDAEELLHKSAELQKLIFDSVDAAIIAADSAGNVTHFNRAAEESLLYKASEVEGGAEVFERIHDPEERKRAAQELSEQLGEEIDPEYVFGVLPRRGRRYVREWTHIRKDGSRYPARVSIDALRGLDGEVIGMVGLSTDLSREKADRAQMDKYIEVLAAKNEELEMTATELKESRDVALAATRTKSEFLANMSHEIRTPMNGVIGMANLLQNTSLNDRQRGFVRTILKSADSLLAILNDILDLSKMEAGKLTFEHFPFDLRVAVEDLCESSAPLVHDKDVELFCLIPSDLPDRVVGDPGRIRQILTNLISNAIKFTSEGEVGVYIRLVRSNPSRATYRFGVRDTGVGIPPDRQESIFDSFTQADGSTTRKFGGTGLGLTICRQLVQMMGGEIGVISEEGRGSEFWFEMTLQLQEGQSTVGSRTDLAGRRILVTDDNATNRTILREMLTAWHCVVDEATSGQEAVARAKVMPYDCAILDMHMPGFDGFDTARELRRHDMTAGLPLILLSSSGFNPENVQAATLFAAVLFKPVRSSPMYNALLHVTGSTGPYHEPVEPPVAIEVDDRLKGLRVLVVEDNIVNQMVATELLESWGCNWQTADNGAAAVAMIENDKFDIVLMDVQMPIMDGFEATAQIRNWEKENGQYTTIIAMTANAMSGDRERCLRAGMDGYLAKPLRPKALVEKLLETIGKQFGDSSGDNDLASDLGAIFDPAGLNETCAGKDSLKIRVIDRYVATSSPAAEDIAAAAREGDVTRLSGAAHGLKGSSLTVGSPALSALCAAVETAARNGQIDQQAVDRIAPTLELLHRTLETYSAELKRAQ